MQTIDMLDSNNCLAVHMIFGANFRSYNVSCMPHLADWFRLRYRFKLTFGLRLRHRPRFTVRFFRLGLLMLRISFGLRLSV